MSFQWPGACHLGVNGLSDNVSQIGPFIILANPEGNHCRVGREGVDREGVAGSAPAWLRYEWRGFRYKQPSDSLSVVSRRRKVTHGEPHARPDLSRLARDFFPTVNPSTTQRPSLCRRMTSGLAIYALQSRATFAAVSGVATKDWCVSPDGTDALAPSNLPLPGTATHPLVHRLPANRSTDRQRRWWTPGPNILHLAVTARRRWQTTQLMSD
jgi:hypothetical protein